MAAAAAAYRGAPISGPVRLEIVFLFPRPKSHFGTGRNADKLKASAPEHCTTRAYGDTSKLIRSTEDAISASSGYPVIEDDSQVYGLSCEKRYVRDTDLEGCGAIIRVIESQYDSIRSSSDIRANAQALVCQ
jgi:crossover junction endodeoxyribonuclease RusA